jgi:hypothetical protein
MITRTLALLSIASIALAAPAQTWRRTYGGNGSDRADDVLVLDEGYLVTGSTGSFGNGSSDAYAVMIDQDGSRLWSTAVGGAGTETGMATIRLGDGFLLAGNTTDGSGGYDVLLAWLDAQGALVSTRTYGSADWDFCNAACAFNGGLIAAGITYEVPIGAGLAMSIGPNGQVRWTYVHESANSVEFTAVAAAHDGGAFLVGRETDNAGATDGIIVKLAEDGSMLWTMAFGGLGDQWCTGCAATVDGGAVTVGSIREEGQPQRIQVRGWDSDGGLIWERFIGNASDAGGASIVSIPSGGFALTGYNTLNLGARDMILTILDSEGWFQFGNNYGNGYPADGLSVRALQDGGFIVAGWCEGPGPGPRAMYVVRTDNLAATAGLGVVPYADVLPVDEVQVAARMHLSPNPVRAGESISIAFPTGIQLDGLDFFDAGGRVVAAYRGFAGGSSLRCPNLQGGLYRMVAKDVQGRVFTLPLLILDRE